MCNPRVSERIDELIAKGIPLAQAIAQAVQER